MVETTDSLGNGDTTRRFPFFGSSAAEYDAPRCDAHATAARYCKAIAAHEAKAPLDRQDRAVIEEQLGCAKIGVVLGAGPARDLRR